MDSDELKKRLTALFADEAQERARALERDLLSLEQAEAGDRVELFRGLFRDAHSLKGAAGLVGIRSIESACHWMEELFAAAGDGRLDLDQEAIGLLLAATDAIAETARRLSDGRPDSGPLAELLPQLASLVPEMPSTRQLSADDRAGASPSGSERTEREAATADEPAGSRSPTGPMVRVPAARLDALLSESGELLVARHRRRARADQITALQELTRSRRKARIGVKPMADVAPDGDLLNRLQDGLRQLGTDVADDYDIIDRAATALDGHLRQARMQPFSQACEGLSRVVRDLAQGSGKSARLVIKGGDVEIDRSLIDKLRDVLRHVVRNAIDHGLETVEERQSAGKSDVGQVTIEASLRGDQVEITVGDDGRGLDVEAIREQVHKRGIAIHGGDEHEIVRSIFLPSFSTSRNVTKVSGRGIGLDAVKTALGEMRGAIDVDHLPGQGTTFTLTLPLTLTSLRALLLSASRQIFAIDTTSVERLIRCSKEDILSVEGQPAILSSSGPVAVIELAEWLGLPVHAKPRADKVPAVILNIAGRRIAIIVEEVLAEQDLVVRGLGPRLSGIRMYSGGTILSDGHVALVLNAAALAEGAGGHRPQREPASFLDEGEPADRKRVLVVDDSVTIRTLQKSILEAAGYEVAVAPDGAEAWQILEQQVIDLVVSDIEMPRMDGFNLTEAIRGSEHYKAIPVILLTARETEQDKARGLQLGADAYLLKSTFDQRQLLDTISQLI